MNKSSRAQEPTYFTAELEFQEHSSHMYRVFEQSWTKRSEKREAEMRVKVS